MTPTSTILHFMAERATEFGLKVIHPESEIGVIMMALGDSYTGERVAVGTSGGGFCLMSEGFSLAGMAELPVVVVLGQRPGPSTGLPTYSSQTELHFALNAGQGEFLRIVVAPGDLEESFHWAQIALNMAAKHRTPVIILTDKNVAEHAASFDISLCPDVKRYAAPVRNAKSVFKVNGYEHDEAGITIEEADLTVAAQDRRLAKIARAAVDLDEFEQVKTYGNANSKDVVLCWGSNKGVCVETATKLGLKVVQPIVMSPFPSAQFARAVAGSERIFAVESNATGQLTQLINRYGFQVDAAVSKYDGRAFSLGELEEKLSGAFAKGGD
jgi:2-oxoglutarate ferredoxin oxidoreductase subunit alpha